VQTSSTRNVDYISAPVGVFISEIKGIREKGDLQAGPDDS
jgi:hypothetical protein